MSPDLDSLPPTWWMLRPGLRVTRRDGTTLQVGLDPRCRTLLPDLPAVHQLLGALHDGAQPDLADDRAREAWSRLRTAGLVVDRDQVTADLAGLGEARRRSAVSAAYAVHGDDAGRRLRERAAARIAVRVLGAHPLARDWEGTVGGLLRDAGVQLASRGNDADATAALIVTGTEPDRELLDRSLATGEPHLLLSTVEGRIRLGPFVVPGRTACLRCVDAHLDEVDPRRSVIVHQYAEQGRPVDAPPPDDPGLMTLALAWATRDLVSYLDGDRPSLWSATVRIEPDLALTREAWTRHPHCGCCWGDLLDVV